MKNHIFGTFRQTHIRIFPTQLVKNDWAHIPCHNSDLHQFNLSPSTSYHLLTCLVTPHPWVCESVTFVDTKAGAKSSVFIEAHLHDVSEIIGDSWTKKIAKLKNKPQEVAENYDHQLLFHKDSLNFHQFDGLVFQSGLVHIINRRWEDGEGEARKNVTVSKRHFFRVAVFF